MLFTPRQSHTLTILIESATVHAAIFTLPEQGLPQMVTSARTSFSFHKELDLSRYERMMIGALMETLLTLLRSAPDTRITQSRCILAAPWHLARISHAQREFDEPTLITEKLISEVAEAQSGELAKEEAEDMEDEAVVLETLVEEVRLNGYPAPHPEGKRAQRLSVEVYASIMGANLRARLEEVIEKVFAQHHELKWSSSAHVFSTVSDTLYHNGPILGAHLHGEMTELVVARNGFVVDRVTFPAGTNTILRSMTKMADMSPEEARTYVLSPASESAKAPAKASEALLHARAGWLTSAQHALASIEYAAPFTAVTALAESKWGEWIMEALKEAQGTRAGAYAKSSERIHAALARLQKGQPSAKKLNDHEAYLLLAAHIRG